MVGGEKFLVGSNSYSSNALHVFPLQRKKRLVQTDQTVGNIKKIQFSYPEIANNELPQSGPEANSLKPLFVNVCLSGTSMKLDFTIE